MVGFANPNVYMLLTGLRKAAAQEEAARGVADRVIQSSPRRRLLCTVCHAALQAGARDD